ncbi:hypothetical protein K9M47_02485 [Candidatus Gracilibacteria bacterium]|nr:hypothetical protein [Candidatus Gracilibacteria bacterium]
MDNNQVESVEEIINNESPNTTQEDSHVVNKKNKQRRVKRIILSLFIISLFFIVTTIYSQYQVYSLKKLGIIKVLPASGVPSTTEQIIKAVSRHILLPDTIPQVAAVQDAKKLSTSQTFFKDAINGDVVLVYKTVIIIYRPSQDIVVAMGDIPEEIK